MRLVSLLTAVWRAQRVTPRFTVTVCVARAVPLPDVAVTVIG